MSTYFKVLLVMGILVVGVCAALPFRRGDDNGENGPDLVADSGVNLRSGEKAPKLVPLAVSAESEASPAAGGLPVDPASRMIRPTAIWKPERLEDSPPADIGPSFHPLVEVSPATTLPAEGSSGSPIRAPGASPFSPTPDQPMPGTVGLTAVDSIPAAPVRHRLRDGDTLIKLARRYLGDEARAEEIYQANRKALSNPDLLPIGVEIEIPGGRVSEER